MAFIGNTNTTQAFTPAVDYFNGDGSTVAFTLSRPVASVAQVQAVIENVPQNPGSAYTVSGNTITFTSAPPSGTSNIYVYYTSPITQVATLSQDPVITGSMTFGTIGARIKGDFSNGTVANRVAFQTSTTNGNTGVFILPNGTAASTAIRCFGNSDPTNASYIGFDSVGATDTRVTSGIYGTGSYLPMTFYTGGSERMRVDTSGNVGIGTSSPTTKLHVRSDGDALNLIGQIQNRNGGGSAGGAIAFLNSNNDLSDNRYAYIGAITSGAGQNGNNLVFATNANGATPSERMRIDSSGRVGINTTTQLGNTLQKMSLKYDGSVEWGMSFQNAWSGNAGSALNFCNFSGTQVGTIQPGASTTSYVTTSDYRLKENVAPMTGALDKLALIKPVTYTWKADGSDGQGFIAHELQEVFPDAVTGEKDAVAEDGSIKPQGIDTSFLVATLTAAIQEQQAIIEDLKARIETLETK